MAPARPARKGPASSRKVAAPATARPATTKSTASRTSTASRRLGDAAKRASTISAISTASRKSTARPALKRGVSKTGSKLLKKDKQKAAEEAALLERAENAESKLEDQRLQLELALMRGADLEGQVLRMDERCEREAHARMAAEAEVVALVRQRGELRLDVAEARSQASRSDQERDAAMEARNAMEKERDDAQEAARQAIAHAEAMEAQCRMAQDANEKAQILMEEATSRDQLREEEARQLRASVAREQTASRRSREEVREEVRELKSRADAERKALRGKLQHARDETVRVRDQLRARQEEVELLADKLRQPRPALELVRDEMREIIQHLLRALREKVAEKDALRGGESLRWKIIHVKMESLTDQIGRIFDIFASKVYEKDAQLSAVQAQLEQSRSAHAETKEKAVVLRTEQDMLKLLFHPEPDLVLRSGYHPRSGAARFGALVGNYGAPQHGGRPRLTSMSSGPPSTSLPPARRGAGRAHEGYNVALKAKHGDHPIPMRARLLLSATRADEVAKIIERNRTWDDACSTLLLSCCVACGAFFLDADMAWPCSCASSHSLTSEHEEYKVLTSQLSTTATQ